MGLYLSNVIVGRHGGTVSLESREGKAAPSRCGCPRAAQRRRSVIQRLTISGNCRYELPVFAFAACATREGSARRCAMPSVLRRVSPLHRKTPDLPTSLSNPQSIEVTPRKRCLRTGEGADRRSRSFVEVGHYAQIERRLPTLVDARSPEDTGFVQPPTKSARCLPVRVDFDFTSSAGVPSKTILPPCVAGAGAEVDDPVGVSHDGLVMFDDDDGLAGVDEAVEQPEELLQIREVKARGGLVEDADPPSSPMCVASWRR